MKTKFILVVFFLQAMFGFAQTWQWASRAGGVGSDKANDIDIDANGNTYIGGYYNVGQPGSYTPTFGVIVPPNTNPNPWGKEGFLAKIDKYGNWQWVKSAVGGYDERVLGVCVDKANNYVYATGTKWVDISPWHTITFGTCSFTANPTATSDDIFVGKFDLAGNCQWLIGAGGDGDDHGFDLVTDRQGNIFLTGFISNQFASQSNSVFGSFTINIPAGDSVSFVAKILPNGIFQWVQTFDGCDGERDNRIAIDSLNNVYIAGGFHGTKAFGTTTLTSSNNSRDVFVIKYDQFGNHIWSKRAGGLFDDRANAITVDATTQKIYVTGEFRDYAYFDLDTINNNGSAAGRDIFVAKMNTAGNWLWAKKAGSKSGDERGNGICTNKKGNIFVTGQFVDTAKFGPIVTLISNPTTTVDAFVGAIDSLGKWQWALKGGGINEDRGNSIACDDSCNLYSAGYYEGAVSFGSNNLAAYGKKDIYVARITNACFNYVLNFDELFANESVVFLFPNPASDFIQIKVSDENFAPDKAKIRIVDLLGKEVNVAEKDNGLIFDVSSLSPGVYSINISYDNKTKVIRFVKQ